MLPPDLRIHGIHAILSHHERYPDATIRLFLRKDRLSVLASVVRYCTERRLVYRVVDDEQLAKVSGASHHEGACLVARARPNPPPAELLPRESGFVLVLDGIDNPHNQGALLRSAAHFGCSAALLCGPERIAGSTYRVAQGGASVVPATCTHVRSAADALAHAGFTIFVCRADGARSVAQTRFPPLVAFVLGNERSGVSPLWAKRGATTLRIDGTGAVESLNVASAGALVMGAYWRDAVK